MRPIELTIVRPSVLASAPVSTIPFAGDDSVGRVRRLYVSVNDRRKGVGTAIIGDLMADARGVPGFTCEHTIRTPPRSMKPTASSRSSAMKPARTFAE